MEKVNVEIDTNYYISDFIHGEYSFHQIKEEQIYGRDKYEKGEFGNDTIFLWEFTVDPNNKKKVEIKYYALDEILGFIGGFFAMIMQASGFIMLPFALIEFVVHNSSKKEEIELQIG